MKYFYSFLIVLGFSSTLQSQNLVVDTNKTAPQLVFNLVGAGINPTNISGQLAPLSNAIFTNNGVSGFSLSSGIILSSGNLDAIESPATHLASDAIFPLGTGDPDIDSLIFPDLSQDASLIEFDFKAANDSVEFNFVFASEEYNEYVNSFNDAFGFFITGPGYNPNTNVAMLPGTTIPITINTVNNGVAPGTSTGPCMNCGYYVDNVGTQAVGLCYDGFTTVINIKFAVWPCDTYHFKIVVADVNDQVFDSAVMLEENSFVACPNLEAFQHGFAAPDTLFICAGGNVTLTAPSGPQYAWSTGDTTQSITVNQPGNYNFVITDILGSCFSISDNITVVQAGVIQTPVISQNMSMLEAPNVVPAPGISYQWNLEGTPIPGATQSTLLFPGNGCYTLTIYEGNCESTSNIVCITNTSIFELSQSLINIYPHPVTDNSIIETPFDENSLTSIQLYDLEGRAVRVLENQKGNSFLLEKGDLSPGIYVLEISNNSYQGTIKRKIIFQ